MLVNVGSFQFQSDVRNVLPPFVPQEKSIIHIFILNISPPKRDGMYLVAQSGL